MMMDWEEYRKQLIATIQQIGQASPDIVRGYRTIADGAGKRFAALQACRKEHPGADDPLFRPIDANDFRINGTEASDFSNLLEHGLVRVTLPLPAKGRGGRCPARAHSARPRRCARREKRIARLEAARTATAMALLPRRCARRLHGLCQA